MNPLDVEELKAFSKIVKNNMPVHTEKTANIPYSFSKGLPKNIMKISNKVDNKFLNDNLHIIEEMEYRKKGITNDFKNYQNKYYKKSEILNHDLYFKDEDKIYAKVSGSCGFIINPYKFVAVATEVFTTTAEVSGGHGLNADTLGASKFAGTPTNGGTYNKIALHVDTFANSGNYRLGVADDSSAPNNIYSGSDTGSIAIPTTETYDYKSMGSSITLTQAIAWAVWNTSTGTAVIQTTASASAWKEHDPSTYGALPATFGAVNRTQPYIIPVKIKYV